MISKASTTRTGRSREPRARNRPGQRPSGADPGRGLSRKLLQRDPDDRGIPAPETRREPSPPRGGFATIGGRQPATESRKRQARRDPQHPPSDRGAAPPRPGQAKLAQEERAGHPGLRRGRPPVACTGPRARASSGTLIDSSGAGRPRSARAPMPSLLPSPPATPMSLNRRSAILSLLASPFLRLRRPGDDQSSGVQAQPGAPPVLNVRQSGAVGDGNRDDSPAFKTALAAVAAAGPGASLYVPSGHYRVAGLSLTRQSVRIWGDGETSVLVGPASGPILSLSECPTVRLRSMALATTLSGTGGSYAQIGRASCRG